MIRNTEIPRDKMIRRLTHYATYVCFLVGKETIDYKSNEVPSLSGVRERVYAQHAMYQPKWKIDSNSKVTNDGEISFVSKGKEWEKQELTYFAIFLSEEYNSGVPMILQKLIYGPREASMYRKAVFQDGELVFSI